MKLHYALAALAVAAMSFGGYAADDPVNLMAGWGGNGRGSADTPTDFGWTATPEITWHEAYNSGDYWNGYRDNLGLDGTQIRALVICQTKSVISYAINNVTKGVYKFSVNASYMNHENIAQTFDFNSNVDGNGTSYGKTTFNTAKWGSYSTGKCDVVFMDDMETVYMCWSVNDTKDRRLSWGYSLVEYTAEEYANLYAEKKSAAEELLANEEYSNVTGQERQTLSTAIATTPGESDYKNALLALTSAVNAFQAAKPSYDGWIAMKAKNDETVKALYTGAVDQYMNPVNEAMAAEPNSAAEAVVATSALETAVAEAIMGKVLGAGTAIEVPGALMPANGVVPDCWTVEGDGKLHTLSGERPDVWNMFTNYYDTDRYNDASWNCKLSQTLNLVPGTYTLALVARSAAREHTYTLFAGDNSVALPSVGNAGNSLGRGWGVTGLTFEVNAQQTTTEGMARVDAETVPVEIGVNIDVTQNQNWFSFNNFKLVQNEVKDNPTGIEVVEAEENAPAVYYNLNGVRVDGNNLTPGVYVVRRGAKAEKIMVK